MYACGVHGLERSRAGACSSGLGCSGLGQRLGSSSLKKRGLCQNLGIWTLWVMLAALFTVIQADVQPGPRRMGFNSLLGHWPTGCDSLPQFPWKSVHVALLTSCTPCSSILMLYCEQLGSCSYPAPCLNLVWLAFAPLATWRPGFHLEGVLPSLAEALWLWMLSHSLV